MRHRNSRDGYGRFVVRIRERWALMNGKSDKESRSAFAKELGVPEPTLSRWENDLMAVRKDKLKEMLALINVATIDECLHLPGECKREGQTDPFFTFWPLIEKRVAKMIAESRAHAPPEMIKKTSK